MIYKRGKYYYYNFRLDGKRYHASTRETDEDAARQFQERLRANLKAGKAIGGPAIVREQLDPIDRSLAGIQRALGDLNNQVAMARLEIRRMMPRAVGELN